MTDQERIAILAATVRYLAPRCSHPTCDAIAVWAGMDAMIGRSGRACDEHRKQVMAARGVANMTHDPTIAAAVDVLAELAAEGTGR